MAVLDLKPPPNFSYVTNTVIRLVGGSAGNLQWDDDDEEDEYGYQYDDDEYDYESLPQEEVFRAGGPRGISPGMNTLGVIPGAQTDNPRGIPIRDEHKSRNSYYPYAYVGRNEPQCMSVTHPLAVSLGAVYTSHHAPDDVELSYRLQPGQYWGWWEANAWNENAGLVAVVHEYFFHHRTLLMLDSGASTSILSLDLARRLKLKLKCRVELILNGIDGVKNRVSDQCEVMVTLGHRVVYTYDVWIDNIGQGIDCLLGMNFMSPRAMATGGAPATQTADFDDEVAAEIAESSADPEGEPVVYYHQGSDFILLDQLKNQLVYLPDLSDLTNEAKIDDAADPGITTPEEESYLRIILQKHRFIFLGEAMPYHLLPGDLDVGEAKPVVQRSRRIPGELLPNVYELLKRLLDSGLVEYSTSAWALPIVIVMKKNGKDIRLYTAFHQNRVAPEQMGPVLFRSSYIYDIIYGAPSWDDLYSTPDVLLYRLCYWNLSVSPPKSEFGVKKCKYLGRDISSDGIRSSPKSAQKVLNLPFPKTLVVIAEHGQEMDHERPVVTRVTPCTGAFADANSAHKYTEMDSASTTNSMRTQSSSSSRSTTRALSHPNKHYTPAIQTMLTVTGLGIDGLSQLSEPAVEANFVFAFVKRSEWQEDINAKDFGCEQDGGSCPVEESTILNPSEEVGELTGVITSAAFRERRTSTRVETSGLLKGERRGWWSAKQFDRLKWMRALVMGAVDDWRTKILLGTGANISAVSEFFAPKLRLRRSVSLDKKVDIQGIAKDKGYTQQRAKVKLTLGWELVYEFEVWIMPHYAGVDVILGTDFMIPAGVRLDPFRSTIKNPEEVVVPLIKSQREVDKQSSAKHVPGSPNDALDVPPGSVVKFKLQRNRPSRITHDLWDRRTNRLVPTVRFDGSERPSRVKVTNVSNRRMWCPAHFIFVWWVPNDDLPLDDGYVQMHTRKYRDWKVLAFAAATDGQLSDKERLLYEEWFAQQPPAVERRQYAAPGGVDELMGTDDDTENGAIDEVSSNQAASSISEEVNASSCPLNAGEHEGPSRISTEHGNQAKIGRRMNRRHARAECKTGLVRGTFLDGIGGVTEPVYVTVAGLQEMDDEITDSTTDDPLADLPIRYVASADALMKYMDSGNDDEFEYEGNEMYFEDYAHELAFLPDLTVPASTILGYDAPKLKNPNLDPIAQLKLVETLRRHDEIMIASGNALPPAAYGVVRDIDVRGHAPIKQRARRIPLKYLRKLSELLKGLLEAGLIAVSSHPWASPIVIVLKKKGQDIRLCIGYKMVNAITLIMEYAMPLVDDLLTEMESYLWLCSLDAASGFWAIVMTMRAIWVLAFVCALGHFEWLRLPFGLKNAPMIYQRMIDNALWGYVQPKGGKEAFAQRMKDAQAKALALRKEFMVISRRSPASARSALQTKYEADHQALAEHDPLMKLINGPAADIFTVGERDQSKLVPVCHRRSFVDDIGFGGSTFDECLGTLDRLLARFAECRISVSFTKSVFVQHKGDFLSYEVTNDGIRADSKKLAAIAEHPFPSSKKGMQAFLGALSYYGWFIQGLTVYGAVLYQLKDEDFAPGGDLSVARGAFTALRRKVAEAPILRHFDGSKDVYILLYANEWAPSSANSSPSAQGVLHAIGGENPALLHTFLDTRMGVPVQVVIRALGVFLSQWHLKIKPVRERDIEFAKLLQSSITLFVSLDEAVAPLAPPSKGSANACNPASMGVIVCRKEMLLHKLTQHKELTAQLKSTRYLHIVRAYNAAADSLATEALESQVTKVVFSESRKAELKALNKIPEVLYVDEPALAETDLPAQSRKLSPTQFAEPTRHRPTRQEAVNEVNDLPADQESPISPQGGAQRSASEVTGNLETILDEPVRADPKEASEREDPTTVQTERIRRERVAQDEERRWADLKANLRGDVESLSFKRAANASKLADRFVLDEDGLLQYVGKGRKLDEVGEHEPQLRLVIPTTMIDEVLQSCHDSIEGGHQGITRTFHRAKKDYYWVALYATVTGTSVPAQTAAPAKRNPI
ncbi:unnamed protein product [Phytophthora fragariaefolia]|uniref:Unnamed protein product n=1 Tax=Phytophthora fragariaefolia TaxID=1490495 RepID=A0A9W6TYJ9_9STRA|nr:unnamed protein product [Phytophthora fragariaefolia]